MVLHVLLGTGISLLRWIRSMHWKRSSPLCLAHILEQCWCPLTGSFSSNPKPDGALCDYLSVLQLLVGSQPMGQVVDFNSDLVPVSQPPD